MPFASKGGASALSDIFSYSSLVNAIAGATGGATAITVFFPLNTARIRIQVAKSEEAKSAFGTIKQIIEEEGFWTLYQGLKSAVVALATSNFVYFYTYSLLKLLYKRRTGKAFGTAANLAVASFAGIVNVLLTSPLWTVNVRLISQRKKRKSKDPNKVYSGITDALVKIGKTEGIKGLWAGVIPSLWLVSNPSVQFVVYERVRGFMDKIAASQNRRINALEFFLMGAVAKAAATFVTYPLQIAQSKLRNDKKGEYSGTVDCLRKIFMKNGFKGLFQGINAKLYQTVLTAAFQFLTYEEVKFLVFYFLLGKKRAVKQANA